MGTQGMTEEFYIDCDGIKLHAKLDKAEGVDRGPLCILIHGFTGHMEEDHIVTVRDALLDSGIMVLRAEMYGHGKSGGEFSKHTLYKWVTNALSVVEYAKKLDFVTDLYICGHSQGGLLVMLIAGMCSDDFRGVIPISPAWMIPEISRKGSVLYNDYDARHIPEKLVSPDWELSGDYIRVAQTIHVEDEIERYDGPVVIIHGDVDEIVPYSYGEKAAKLYKNAKLITIHGAGHCFVGQLDELYNAVRSCIREIV